MKHNRTDSAFSLVEIVMALGLVSFSMLAIFALLAHGHKTSRESRLESVAAILAGQITSQLRATYAWDMPASGRVADYTGNKNLAEIARVGSTPVIQTNYKDQNLSTNVLTATDPDRQFAVVTEIGPVSSANLSTTNSEVSDAISRLGNAENTVYLKIEISSPALAPEANRSKRTFYSLITRTSPN
jgi:type II secretory pathway pseudopilin PulG